MLAVIFSLEAMAWGKLGHQVVAEIAERHLTEKAKANIAKYMPYALKQDALWMDYHRKDEPIKYTTAWHVYNVNDNHEYDPNPRLAKGDCVLACEVADYNLRNREKANLTDSAVLMNLRMIIHFVGDLHCPTHSYFPGPRCFWKCNLKGKSVKNFHHLYDVMPEKVHGKKANSDEVATKIDNCSKKDIKKISAGSFRDWAKSSGDNNYVIYEINPFNTVELAPDTVERSEDVVNIQMRNAGYRLAKVLNEYFGK